jgi:hypothetical protein
LIGKAHRLGHRLFDLLLDRGELVSGRTLSSRARASSIESRFFQRSISSLVR